MWRRWPILGGVVMKPRFFVHHLSSGQLSSLNQLEQQWRNTPTDPEMTLTFVRELMHLQPLEGMKRFESGEFKMTPETITEYLNAATRQRNVDRAARFISRGIKEGHVLASPSSSPWTLLWSRSEESPVSSVNANTVSLNMKDVAEALDLYFRKQSIRRHRFILISIALFFLYSLSNKNNASPNNPGEREEFVEAMRRMVGLESVETLKEVPKTRFNDVKGCDEAIDKMRELVDYLKHPDKYAATGGRVSKGILLVGPSGTGKTLLAKAVAGEAGVPFLYRSGAQFDERFVGVGSSRVRELFRTARQLGPCIIFIDEIDALAAKRVDSDSGHHRASINQLLTEMDGFVDNDQVIVIGATNKPEAMDPAALRPGRFGEHVTVPLPDIKGRLSILEHYLKQSSLSSNVDLQRLARSTPQMSGSALYQLTNKAKLYQAKRRGQKLEMRDLELAREEMQMGISRSVVMTEADKLLVAVHEGGHALVGLLTPGSDEVHKATVMPRGQALGMVWSLPYADLLHLQKFQLLARIDVCMAGRVAEELFYGAQAVTSGASSDFQQATRIAHYMVTQCGMSEKVGPMAIENESELSPVMKQCVDEEKQRLLKESYDRVKGLLMEHKRELKKVALALVEHETLSGEALRRLILDLPLDSKDGKITEQRRTKSGRALVDRNGLGPRILDDWLKL